jgi:hypothetical protein
VTVVGVTEQDVVTHRGVLDPRLLGHVRHAALHSDVIEMECDVR